MAAVDSKGRYMDRFIKPGITRFDPKTKLLTKISGYFIGIRKL